MARTVGYTAAIAAQMILTGEVQQKGMLRPLKREFYRTALRRLEDLNIRATVRTRELPH
jgi:saccharopine dehydrogenase-like NADP-dependent oxidoreductase